MKKNVIFIGDVSPPITGPGIKYSILIKALNDNGVTVKVINSLRNKLKFICDTLLLIFNGKKKIIFAASTKLTFILTPYLYFLILINKANVIFMPNGGRIVDELNHLPFPMKFFYLKFFNSFDQIYIESTLLKLELEKLFDKNHLVSYLPNFKYRPNKIQEKNRSEFLRLVYLGRMAERKGIFDLVNAVEILIKKGYKIKLDFFGSFLGNDPDKNTFINIIKDKDYISFNGIIEPESIQNILPKFDIFIFPTHHKREGFPGVILDAFFSGLPIIAANWRYRGEIIIENINGLYFNAGDMEGLPKQIEKLYFDRDLLEKMSKNAWSISEKYDINLIIKRIIEDFDNFGWFE
jgi:glycosyltransferase involved in cell wall biosynthesis